MHANCFGNFAVGSQPPNAALFAVCASLTTCKSLIDHHGMHMAGKGTNARNKHHSELLAATA